MSADEIRQRLLTARSELDESINATRSNWIPVNAARYWAAHDAVLVLERELAAALGEEHAVPLDFPGKWDRYPKLRLLCNELKALLAFHLRQQSFQAAGSTIRVAGKPEAASIALVEFSLCTATRLGTPNDEVHEGHPLSGRGLDSNTAQKVVNSRWVAELEAINKVHHCYRPEDWQDRNHYVFWFRDSTFECIAKSFTVEVYRESDEDVLTRMCQRLRD